jgi:hypothetical protein
MLSDAHICFIPECYLDTNLVEFLLGRANSVNHSKGISSVAAKMKGKRFDNFAVAIIDEDKRKLKELENCVKVTRLWRAGLKLFKKRDQQHYFIQLCPAIEKWIVNECEKGLINLVDYDLPVSFDDLKKLKGFAQINDDRFRKLFEEMLRNESCDEIVELKRWLKFLKENNYNTDLDLL